MKTKEKVAEVGIIGQMYEDRKTKRVGVLESREEKFKTLMLRDKEGKSFNITYSTFRSNWRKYQGEEVVQTSTQVEEQKVEDKKEVEKAEKEIKKSKTVRPANLPIEERVKQLNALSVVVQNRIDSGNYPFNIVKKARGGIAIKHSRTIMFEAWVKYGMDKYDIFIKDVVCDEFPDKFKALSDVPTAVYSEHVKWILRHGYRVENTNLEQLIDAVLDIANAYVEKHKNDKNETNEEEE